jgi:hypothetical protein
LISQPPYLIIAVVRPCAELISCDRHLSIQSALLSASPIKLRLPTDDVEDDVTEDMDWQETVAVIEEDDEFSDDEHECDECERERLALVDSPPVLVQSGTPQSISVEELA